MRKYQRPVAGLQGNVSKKTNFFSTHLYRKLIAALAFALPSLAGAQTPDTLIAVRDADHNTRLSVYKNGALLAGGQYNPTINAIPAQGAGTRMMWYPEKAAFRSGGLVGTFTGITTQWDDINIGGYSFAAGEDVRASGDHSVALGKLCTASQQSSFAMGEQNTASGAASVAMGYHAHTNARQGSFVFADRSTVDTLRAGVNHSSNWRVSGGFRIFTSSNLSTGVTLQSGASVSNWGQANAVISTSTGAYLSTGGVWTNVSDVNRKHNFEAISGEDILSQLSKIKIQQWSYLSDNDNVRHIGPTAQDFRAAFGLGNDERSIGTVDADGVALASIQALEARTSKIAGQLEELKAENTALRDRLEALEKRTTKVTAAGLPWIIIIGGIGVAGLLTILLRRRTTMGSVNA